MRQTAVVNLKGGVGKTTTVINLSHALARMGKKVTVFDIDPQAHLTAAFGIDHRQQPGVDALLLGQAGVDEVRLEVRERLHLVPTGPRLAEVKFARDAGPKQGWLLHEQIKDSLADEDFVLFDCPPSSDILTMNALFAAREVLVPVTGDYLALKGLSQFMGIMQHIEKALDVSFKIRFLMTRFQRRKRLARGVLEKLLEYFPGQILATPIRENVSLAESPGFGKTIYEYRRKSIGADDYTSLAKDFTTGRTM